MRWSLISADGVKLPFHQQGNQVSFKWKSSWNLFIPKFAANIPEEMLPSKRQWHWERGPISDVIVIRYRRNFPHPQFLLTPSFPVLVNVGKDGNLPANDSDRVPWAGNNTGECQPSWLYCPGTTQADSAMGLQDWEHVLPSCFSKLASLCYELPAFPGGAEASVGGENESRLHPPFPWKQHTMLRAQCRTEFQRRWLFTGTYCGKIISLPGHTVSTSACFSLPFIFH